MSHKEKHVHFLLVGVFVSAIITMEFHPILAHLLILILFFYLTEKPLKLPLNVIPAMHQSNHFDRFP